MTSNNNRDIDVTCPLCRAKKGLSALFRLKTYSIIRCSSCKVRFSSVPIDNKSVYGPDFIDKNSEYLNSDRLNPVMKGILRPYIEVECKKVLDVGCGSGIFLEHLKDKNEVLGLEISEGFIPILEKKGVPHKIGDLKTQLSLLPDRYFDLITLWDVFEHLDGLPEILKLLTAKLKAGGIIINWTNNYDDFINLFSEYIYRFSSGFIHIFAEKCFNRQGGHNFNFIPESLSILYNANKLTIEKTIITDTPSNSLTRSLIFRFILDFFYMLNRMHGKGKIVCHVLRKPLLITPELDHA